jgi:hypothetical protein
VEAEERDIEQVEKLEGDVGLELGRVHRAAVVPGAVERAAAEGVTTLPRKGMPVGDGRTDDVLHALAQDLLVLVVVAERQGIFRARTLEGHGLDALEEIGHLRASSMAG